MSPTPRTPPHKSTRERKTQTIKPARRKPTAFESFAETTSVAIVITQGHRILYANPAAARSTGYSYEELLEMGLWQLAHPNYQQALKQSEKAPAWTEHIPSRFEIKIVTKGGEERWWDVTVGGIAYQGKSAIAVTAFDITERDRAERALRTTHAKLEARVQERTIELATLNERLNSILSSITEAYVIFDSNWRFLVINPNAERKVFGRPAGELIGKVIWDEYPQTVGQEVYEQYHLAVETGQPVHFETPSQIALGRWFEVHAYPRSGGLEAYFHDITERKQAEVEIASLAKFPSENPNPVLRLNQAGEVLYANEASQTLLQTWARTTGDTTLSYWRSLAAQAVASQANKAVDIECGGRAYSFSVVPIVEAGYVNFYGRDITARKQVEEALRESEERYRLLFDNSLDGILLTTPEGGIQAVNVAACRMLERTEQEICQLGRNGVVDVSDPRVAAAVEERAHTGKAHAEMFFMRGDGTRFLGEVSSTMFKGKDGRLRTSMIVRDITKRKQVEEALLESEEKYRRLIENVNDLVCEVDAQARYQFVNSQYEQVLGYAPDELLGHYVRELIHPDDLRQSTPSFKKLVDGGSVSRNEWRFKHKNGEWRWFDCIAQTYEKSPGEQRVVVISRDVTERKEKEEELRRTRDYLENLFQYANAPIICWDTQLNITRFNHAFETLTGHAAAEVLGRHLSLLFPQDSQADSLDKIKRTLTEKWQVVEIPILRKDGETRIALWNSANVYAQDGQTIEATIAQGQDITELKRAEEALRQTRDELEIRVQERTEELEAINQELRKEIEERRQIEKQLHLQMTAVRAAANGIVLTDRQGHIQWCNPAFTHMTGYSAEEVAGQTLRILNSGQQTVEFYGQLWTTILAGEIWRGELTNRRKDGCLYVEEQTIAPVLNEQREITHFVAVKQDITERKQAEDRLERYNQDLLALSKAERAQRQLAETLTAANLALTQSLNLETVLETLLEYVARLVPYDSANVMLLEAESRLVVRVTRGYERWSSAEQVRAITFDTQTAPVLNALLTTRRSSLVPDTRLEPGWQTPPGVEHVRSWLGVPLMAGGNVIGLYSLDKTEPGFFTTEHVRMAEMLVGQAAVAIQNAWLFEQVRAGRERLQSLSRRLVEAQEAERHYVARELHDEAGQALTSLLFKLGQLEQQTADPRQADQLAELKQMTNGVLESLHRLAMDLRPASLDHLGLVPALYQYVKAIGDRYGVIAQFKAVGFEGERLPTDVETAVYRIVQEALTNIVRHAHATRADVLLEQRGDRVIVVVEDNGLGFDADVARFAQQGRLGLVGIQERAEMLGGSFVIESTAGAGTTVVVEVPYDYSHFDR